MGKKSDIEREKPLRLRMSEVRYPTERVLQRYNLKQSDYDRMYTEQGGACAICLNNGTTLLIDHEHYSGEVRGLLCSICNSILGFASDDPRILRNAVAYLRLYADEIEERLRVRCFQD